MALHDELRTQGEWLFRHRSYLPLVLAPFLALAVWVAAGGETVGLWDKPWWQLCCLGTGLLGLVIRAIAVGHAAPGTSGRNTRGQKAESVNTTGIYAMVRHPLYLGNFLLFLGVVLFPGVWWFALIASLAYWLYYERIMYAEEQFLLDKHGEAFSTWAGETPAIVPDLRRWQRPARPFSARKALRGEYPTAFGIVASLAGLDALLRSLSVHAFAYNRAWAIGAAAALVFYVAVRVIAKRTRFL